MNKLVAVASLALVAAACSDSTGPEEEVTPALPVYQVPSIPPPQFMKSGYSMECSGPTSRPLCLIKYLGAGIMTIATPEACATVVLCAGAVAGTGLAWVDYYYTPDCEGCGPWDQDPRFENREERNEWW